MIFDVRTLYLSGTILSIVFALSMFIVWFNNKNRYRGIIDWIISIICVSIGTGLIMFRDTIDDFFSIYIANLIVFVAFTLFLKGYAKFMNIKNDIINHSVFVTLLASSFIYFTYIEESLSARNFIVGLAGVYTFSYMLYYMYVRTPKYYLKQSRLLELTSWGFVLVNLLRVFIAILMPSDNNNLFANRFPDVVAAIIMVIFTGILPLAFLILINNRALNEVQVEEMKFENAFYDSPVIMLITRLSNGMIYDVNKAFTHSLGFEKQEAVGKTTLELGIWPEPAARKEVFRALEESGKIDSIELQFKRKDNSIIETVYSSRIINMLGEQFIISLANDVTQLGEAKKELVYMATHDALTGLLNRHELSNHFQELKLNYQKTKVSFALIMIDLDKFKPINDTFGHDFGDKVLIQVGEFLKAIFKGHFVARLGGDEFIVLLKDETRETEIIKRLMKTRQVIAGFTNLEGNTFELGASLGYAIYPSDGTTLEALIHYADKGMYQEKTAKQR